MVRTPGLNTQTLSGQLPTANVGAVLERARSANTICIPVQLDQRSRGFHSCGRRSMTEMMQPGQPTSAMSPSAGRAPGLLDVSGGQKGFVSRGRKTPRPRLPRTECDPPDPRCLTDCGRIAVVLADLAQAALAMFEIGNASGRPAPAARFCECSSAWGNIEGMRRAALTFARDSYPVGRAVLFVADSQKASALSAYRGWFIDSNERTRHARRIETHGNGLAAVTDTRMRKPS